MNKKFIYQIIIALIILILSAVVYYKYFKINKIDKNIEVVKNNKNQDFDNLNNNEKNIIEDIKYFKEDVYGNQFTLEAKKGEIIQDENKKILLIDVYGIIKLKNKSEILIFSKFAEYDSNNFDTKFYSEVKATYENNIIESENLDLFFKDNYGEMYNNIKFYNNDSEITADKLFFDLVNGDIKINMYNVDDKITIIKN